jgi:hypothetical protein
MEVLDEFLMNHPEFVIDLGHGRFLMTSNPHGFLMRVP